MLLYTLNRHTFAMCFLFALCKQLYFISHPLGVHCQELSKDTKNQGPFPVYPSVGYQILNADHLLLRENSQELLGNSSLQAQRQAFLITNPRAGLLQPAVNVTFGFLSVERPIGPELLLGRRRILPVILARQVLSSAPIIRILFHMPSMASGSDAGGGRAGEGVGWRWVVVGGREWRRGPTV